MKKIVLLAFIIVFLTGCGQREENDIIENNLIETEQLTGEMDTHNDTEKLLPESDKIIEEKTHTNNFLQDVKLYSSDETTQKVVDEKCGEQEITTMSGTYTLQKGDATIDLGSLTFIENDELYNKNLEHYNINNQDIIVYYQQENCHSIKAYFVAYDGKKLRKIPLFYPASDSYEDSFIGAERINKDKVISEGLTLVAHPGGVGIPYELFFFINKDGALENRLVGELAVKDYQIIPSTVSVEKPDYSEVKTNDFYSVQPMFIEYDTLQNLDEGSAMIESFSEKETIKKANGVTLDIYTFTEASTFEYIINITKDNVQQYLFTHVIRYDISDDGRHLYIDNYTYNEYEDSWTNRWRIINLETREEHEFDYSYCLMWNGNQGFQGDMFYTFGQANNLDKELYGLIESEICLYDTSSKKFSKYLTNIQRMACSATCPVDQVGFLPNNNEVVLFIDREDFSYIAGDSDDTIPKKTNFSLYLFEDNGGSLLSDYHITIYDNQNPTEIPIEQIEFTTPLYKYFSFWQESKQ